MCYISPVYIVSIVEFISRWFCFCRKNVVAYSSILALFVSELRIHFCIEATDFLLAFSEHEA